MEEKVSTRERILIESLKLFSKKGYDGVSMREIASAVGIKGASIYTHFSGKQDIFNEIFVEMTKRYSNMAMAQDIPVESDEDAAQFYAGLNEERLFKMTEGLFSFFARDEFASMFRKLLIVEQYKTDIAGETLKAYYLDAPVNYQEALFRKMQEQGCFKGYDPRIMALHFYSPVFYMLNAYDLGKEYNECIEELKDHVKWFGVLYCNDTKPC